MITKKTVFILGAGASKPYGYPTGEELREFIANDFVQRLERYLGERNKHHIALTSQAEVDKILDEAKQFTQHFNDSGEYIDRFLNRYEDNPLYVEFGKKAILYKMFSEEKKGAYSVKLKKISASGSLNSAKYNHHHDWINFLFRKIFEGHYTSESYVDFFNENKVSFITFNYDRTIEHFFCHYLIHNYYKDRDDLIKSKLGEYIQKNIFHVYGTIAPLPWQDHEKGIEYQTATPKINFNDYLDNIKIMYEQRQADISQDIQDKIKEADDIFLLGFGFLPENLKILNLPAILNEKQHVFATAYKEDEEKILRLRSKFYKSDGKNPSVVVRDMDCKKLLDTFMD